MSAIRFGCRQVIINMFQEKLAPSNLYPPVSAGKITTIVGNALILPTGTEYATVCGPVVSAYFATSMNGQPTFLNIGNEYPDPKRFTALI